MDKSRIYIPLCFYFIKYTEVEEILEILFTFHYASTLSGLTPRPLTPVFRIYIPLCFYFIPTAPLLWSGRCVFTFHYASTLSLPSPNQWNAVTLFTFHYASTLSRTRCRLWAQETNLHSTMLLLYLKQQTAPVLVSLFTFHYASTLSHLNHKRHLSL